MSCNDNAFGHRRCLNRVTFFQDSCTSNSIQFRRSRNRYDSYLGGKDFDNRIIDWIANQFQRLEGIDLRQDRHALQRLTEEAERVKSQLSNATQADVHLPFIAYHLGIPKHLDLTLTRAEFEAMCSDLLVRCRIPIEQALKAAKITMDEVNEVIVHD